jgi:hypothetical protein
MHKLTALTVALTLSAGQAFAGEAHTTHAPAAHSHGEVISKAEASPVPHTARGTTSERLAGQQSVAQTASDLKANAPEIVSDLPAKPTSE